MRTHLTVQYSESQNGLQWNWTQWSREFTKLLKLKIITDGHSRQINSIINDIIKTLNNNKYNNNTVVISNNKIVSNIIIEKVRE